MRKILFLLFITLLSCSTNYDDLSNLDIVTTNREISEYTDISHV